MTMQDLDDVAADTLQGAVAIAGFLGKTERQANYLLEKRQLPAFKLAGRWHMRRSTYAAHIAKLEAAALEARSPRMTKGKDACSPEAPLELPTAA